MEQFAFKSLADLSRDVRVWLDDLPHDIEVVAGIPRSGLMVANMISLHRHLPMTDINGLISGRLLAGGRRLDVDDSGHFLGRTRRVLVVDDSVYLGQQLEVVRRQLEAASLPHELRFASVYVDPGKEHLVDFFHEALSFPRMFEWNFMHHAMLQDACVDIDGVLCRDPTPEENDDGIRYAEFLETVGARVKPAYPINTLVTCRLEKYRAETVAWLARNDIRFENLVMMPYSSKAERVAAGRHAAFKAEAYMSAHTMIFIESSVAQARDIADMTVRPVICTDRMKLIEPRVRTKTDILVGLRQAGSLSRRIRWLRAHRKAIMWWAGRRRRRAAQRRRSRSEGADSRAWE